MHTHTDTHTHTHTGCFKILKEKGERTMIDLRLKLGDGCISIYYTISSTLYMSKIFYNQTEIKGIQTLML